VAKDIEQGVVYQNGDLKVTAFTVDHAPIKPAFGYRIDYGGHSWCSPEIPATTKI